MTTNSYYFRPHRFGLLLAACLLFLTVGSVASTKREFRGAWIQCVNGQFTGIGRDSMQTALTYQLDALKRMGCNAIFFQVRPECDALYESKIEPWSRLLTGKQGVAPSPYWDPLDWMVNQCHRRGMELHAWVNPYRAKTKMTNELAQNHIVRTHPERAFLYDGQYILNPALQENRDYICSVVTDIICRYDIDGIHIDDYFYPYPVAGQSLPDEKDYMMNTNGIKDIGDWRRHNVNLLIKQLSDVVRAEKPWMKFGVSPFGIYRNKKSSDMGSDTNGLQDYDDLYADVLMWVNNGWIDYCAPQLYWQIGHPTADYEKLMEWWNRYAKNRPLFIGEDVERTVKFASTINPEEHQLEQKMQLHRHLGNVNGTVLWYAKVAVDDIGNYGSLLRTKYWRTPALQPLMPFISKKTPGKVRNFKARWTLYGYMLEWDDPKWRKWDECPEKYVIYRFAKGEKVDLNKAANIVTITTKRGYQLPYKDGKTSYTYVVTPLNRIDNEGNAKKVKVKL